MKVVRWLSMPLLLVGMLVCSAPSAHADPILVYEALLFGSNETPPNGSPGTGIGFLTLNAAMDHFDVDLTWTGLTAPATAAHIHTGAPGVMGPVTFPFTGISNTTSGHFFTTGGFFAISATQLATLQAGNMYMNIHDANFPAGEIRGQLMPTPEPASLILLSTGLLGVGRYARRRYQTR
jgi:hypothetical protein